jgi:NACalpha-BTF3-like transcription factor
MAIVCGKMGQVSSKTLQKMRKKLYQGVEALRDIGKLVFRIKTAGTVVLENSSAPCSSSTTALTLLYYLPSAW